MEQQVTINDIDDMRALAASEGYTANITGDACVGDEVIFAKAIFSGSFRKPKFAGYEIIRGIILRESYGANKAQHTFTLSVAGTIKGRNLYRNGLWAKPRASAEREEILAEKHRRGGAARAMREAQNA